MRKAGRGAKPAPNALAKRDRNKRTEIERVRAHMQSPLPANGKRESFEFKAYKADEVKRRLEELFHGKCAYCESVYASQAPVDVEHYRPKGAVEGAADHPGYWWLAMDWNNLLPSCIDCNRRRKQKTPHTVGDLELLHRTMLTGKKDCFPIAGQRIAAEGGDISMEQALLLDPTRDDPAQHLQFWIDAGHAAGLVLPRAAEGDAPALPAAHEAAANVAAHAEESGLSVRGAVSIQIYGLNRLRLVQERARLLRQLRFLEYLVIKLADVIQTLSKPHLIKHGEIEEAIASLEQLRTSIIDEMKALAAPEAPFSALARTYLDDFKARLSA